MKKIAIIAGTRPEVIKLSPIIEAIKSENGLEPIVISSGQQGELLNQTLREFGIVPKFKAELNFRNSSLFNHVATLTEEIGKCLESVQPSFILTQGDTSSAFAGTLSGFLLGIPVGHVEAGLRSQNLKSPFPEEGYRQLISRIASIHFAPTELAAQNLLAEGIDSKIVKVVGNTIVDAVQDLVSSFANNARTKKILVTLHRRENFGEPLEQIAQAIGDFAKSHKEVIFNVIIHPNPNSGLFLSKALSGFPNINLLPPLNYRDLLSEILTSAAVLTDSGGIQEECAVLRTRLLIARNETERPEVLSENRILVGVSKQGVYQALDESFELTFSAASELDLDLGVIGDGHSSVRIIQSIKSFL